MIAYVILNYSNNRRTAQWGSRYTHNALPACVEGFRYFIKINNVIIYLGVFRQRCKLQIMRTIPPRDTAIIKCSPPDGAVLPCPLP